MRRSPGQQQTEPDGSYGASRGRRHREDSINCMTRPVVAGIGMFLLSLFFSFKVLFVIKIHDGAVSENVLVYNNYEMKTTNGYVTGVFNVLNTS